MAEVTKCGQLLSHFRHDINIYKVTNKQKESDERAKNTVIESLTNPSILQRFHKVNYKGKYKTRFLWNLEN